MIIVLFHFFDIIYHLFSFLISIFNIDFIFFNKDEFISNLFNDYDNSNIINNDNDDNNDNKDNKDNKDNNDNKGKKLVSVHSDSDKDNDSYRIIVDKEFVGNTLETLGQASKIIIKEITPNIGAAGAGGAAAAAMVKASTTLPPMQRAVAIGGTAFITSASVKLGLEAASKISDNIDLLMSSTDTDTKSEPEQNNPDIDFDNLDYPIDISFVNSPIEIGDTSPLEFLLTTQLTFNIFILFLISNYKLFYYFFFFFFFFFFL